MKLRKLVHVYHNIVYQGTYIFPLYAPVYTYTKSDPYCFIRAEALHG